MKEDYMANSQDRSLQMLFAALELEKKGEAFYKEAVITCQNDLGREIFRMLVKDEGLHMDRILKIYNSLKVGQTWSDQRLRWSLQPRPDPFAAQIEAATWRQRSLLPSGAQWCG